MTVAMNLLVLSRFPLLNHQAFKHSAFVKGLRRAEYTPARHVGDRQVQSH